jgi:hypothetical protein
MYISERPPVPMRAMRDFRTGLAATAAGVSLAATALPGLTVLAVVPIAV